jgi:hypothetical protein
MEHHQLSWLQVLEPICQEPTYLQSQPDGLFPEAGISTNFERTPSFSVDGRGITCPTLTNVEAPAINANTGGIKKRFIIPSLIAHFLVHVEHSVESPLETTVVDGVENSSARSVEK